MIPSTAQKSPSPAVAAWPAREINLIVIHCSASPNGASLFRGKPGEAGFRTPVMEIDAWHRARDFARQPEWRARHNPDLTSVGYHFLIYLSGVVATGRHLDEIGAHAAPHNRKSIGVCMIGTDHFTPAQWAALASNITALKRTRPGARVVGHRDLSPDLNGDGKITSNEWIKTCPGFEVADWLAGNMAPLADHVLEATA